MWGIVFASLCSWQGQNLCGLSLVFITDWRVVNMIWQVFWSVATNPKHEVSPIEQQGCAKASWGLWRVQRDGCAHASSPWTLRRRRPSPTFQSSPSIKARLGRGKFHPSLTLKWFYGYIVKNDYVICDCFIEWQRQWERTWEKRGTHRSRVESVVPRSAHTYGRGLPPCPSTVGWQLLSSRRIMDHPQVDNPGYIIVFD